ncbi:MAG: hypothetical protein HZB99_02365 [Candidatus Harrisonbacteria bacterium]|nr:hypothetical protein [Candidatus Harrisonbacteria bacterium]
MKNNSANNLLAASIVMAALLVSASWIYSVSKQVSAKTQGVRQADQKEISTPIKGGGGCGI